MSFNDPQTPGGPVGPPPVSPQDEKLWGALCHLSALAGDVGVPFGHIAGPLIVWLIKKDQIPFVDDQGKEALNFQISITLYIFLCIPLVFLLIGIPMIFGLVIFQLVATIIGGVKASTGAAFRYPLNIRFIS